MQIRMIGPQQSFKATATIVNEAGRRTQEISTKQLEQAKAVIAKEDWSLKDIISKLLEVLDIKAAPASNRLYLEANMKGISFGDISAKGAEGTTAAFGGLNIFVS